MVEIVQLSSNRKRSKRTLLMWNNRTVRAIQLSSKCTTILRKEIATISYPSAAKKKSHPSGVTDGMIIAITNMAMLEVPNPPFPNTPFATYRTILTSPPSSSLSETQ
jgi:hypothetical protein